MKLNTYILLQYAINFLRHFLWPIIAIFGLFIPILKVRNDFEARNIGNKCPKKEGITADVCFHVSSEGELQQCLIIIKEYLKRNKVVELVYTSPSVERKCTQLDSEYDNLYSFRLPLVKFPFMTFTKWVSAKKLFMCRYDFYSDLMLYGAREDVEFILLSGSLKGKEHKLGSLLRQRYSLFNYIYTASDNDKALFEKLDVTSSLESFEFRLLQIVDRLEAAKEVLSSKLEMKSFLTFIKDRDINKNIILGSSWPNEMQIFSSRELCSKISSGELFICIAPHDISNISIKEFIKCISEVNPSIDVQVFKENENIRSGAVVINPYPGILLESFTLFGHSYIGGGHTRSIHSVLEPFLANTMIYCGPKTHRSTEYDFVNSYGKEFIKVIDNTYNLYENIQDINRNEEISNRSNLINEYKSNFKRILERVIC